MSTIEELELQRELLVQKAQGLLRRKKERLTNMLIERKNVLENDAKVMVLDEVDFQLKSYVEQTVKPFKQIKEHYVKEREAGAKAIGESLVRPSWKKTPIGMATGVLQYSMSPISAGAKTVGGAVEEAFSAYEIPQSTRLDPYTGKYIEFTSKDKKAMAKFAGKLGEEAIYWVPVGGSIRQLMMMGKPGLKASTEIKKAPELLPSKFTEDPRTPAGVTFDKVVPPKARTSGPLKKLTKPQVKQQIIDDITHGATKALEGNLDESQRIFKQISERLAVGEIHPEYIPEILKKNKITPEQFAKMYEETVSFSGRILGYHGRAAKELNFAFRKHPEAQAILESAFRKELKEPYFIDKVFQVFGKIENTRRAMLVGQVATAVRNAWSQAGRITLSSLDEALQGAIRGTVGGEGQTFKQIAGGLNSAVAALGKLSPKNRKRVFDILEQNHAAISKARLFSQPVHEVGMGKVASLVNTLNRGQEYFFRRLAFEAKLRQLLQRKGLKFSEVNPKHIPEGFLEESVNYALEMTFAASPKSKSMQNFVKWWTNSPMTLVNPFPRFNFGNAIPFLYEHSPLGYLGAVKPSTLKKLANGNPDEFAKAASRATIGSVLLNQAMRFRQSDKSGERWYEIKEDEDPTTGKSDVIDTRAFAPFSTYLFIAEALTQPERLKPMDYTQAAIGLNRIAGSGLVVADWLRAGTGEDFKKQVGNFVGQYISSFTVPVRTIGDVYSAFDEEEAIYRDYKQNPLIAPTLMNLPKISQIVPEKYSFMKKERMRKGEEIKGIPAGIFRQLTGLSKRTKTMVEREVDEIGLEWRRIAPKTGNPHADRLMSKYMAPVIESYVPFIIKGEVYKKLSTNLKRLVLGEVFKEARLLARKRLATSHPKLTIDVAIDRLNKDLEKEVRQHIGE